MQLPAGGCGRLRRAQRASIPGYAEVISALPESVCKHMPSADEIGGEIANEIGVIEAG